MSEKQKKQTVATNLESIPTDILDQNQQPAVTDKVEPTAEAKPAEAKKAEEQKPIKVTVKKLEVREKAEPQQAQKSEEASKPAAEPASSLTMSAVEKEINSIKQRLGVLETGQASAEARLKALEATNESVAKSLAALTEIQTRQSVDLDSIRQQSNDCTTVVANMAAEHREMKAAVSDIGAQQQVIADGLVSTQRRQTPWGLVTDWWERRQRHAAAVRATMNNLKRTEYEQSLQAVAKGEFKSAEA
jgi:hypothetical protein